MSDGGGEFSGLNVGYTTFVSDTVMMNHARHSYSLVESREIFVEQAVGDLFD
jgi:hypothetical protein